MTDWQLEYFVEKRLLEGKYQINYKLQMRPSYTEIKEVEVEVRQHVKL